MAHQTNSAGHVKVFSGRGDDQREHIVSEGDVFLSSRVTLEEILRLKEELDQKMSQWAEETDSAAAELRILMSVISHELRTPLRAIQGFGEALVEDYGDSLKAEPREYVERMVRAAERMDSMILELLEFSRLARKSLRIEPVDLEGLVHSVLADLESSEECRQGFILPSSYEAVLADREVLQQILAALFSNGLKFVKPGCEPQVSFSCEKVDIPGGEYRVRIAVEDHGIGIADHHLQRIFRVFEKLHGIEHYPGTGIGLALAERGARCLGSRLAVQSELGLGSRFWLDLPPANVV